MNPIVIIGMGTGLQDLTAAHLSVISQADILVGGKRQLEIFKDSRARKKAIGRNLDETIRFVKGHMKKHRIAVLASGDPLFFGIGATLSKALGPQHVRIYPNVSAVAAAFARIKEPWSNVPIISLHGRKNQRQLLRMLETKDLVAVYTDPQRNPVWLARQLTENEMICFQMGVFEQLGSHAERFGWYSPLQAAIMTFAEPNVVVLKRGVPDASRRGALALGMPDCWFAHQEGLITKSEVRAVVLSKLQLASHHTLWDLGAGSGSVAIEASVLVKQGRICAVEKCPDRIAQIQRNKNCFGVKNLLILQALLPAGLDALPDPDRIFIGGAGKDLAEIIRAASARLRPNGIIVINTVLIPNLQTARNTLEQLGFHTDMVQVQVSRSTDMPWGQRLEAQNPVWIIRGMRNADASWRDDKRMR